MCKHKRLRIMSYYKRFIPGLFVLAIIIYLTCQSPEDTWRVSSGLRDFFMKILPNAYGRWTTDMHWFRSLLHLPMYFVLGAFVQISIATYKKSVLICSCISLVDETLKVFLPTREFEIRDLGFDAVGYIIGILIVALFSYCITGICKKRKVSCEQ